MNMNIGLDCGVMILFFYNGWMDNLVKINIKKLIFFRWANM